MMTTKNNRPGGIPEAAGSVATTPYQDTEAPHIPHLSAADIANSRPLYVLVVKTPTERLNRRTYLSLPAAEKACKRAQARGSAAMLELHRLVPYIVGAELHGLEAVSTDV